MKHSIKKIFQNLNTYMLFIMFISFLFMAMTLEKQLSYEKVDNLNNQKNIVNSLTKLKKTEIELALIQFNGKSAQLHSEINKLYNINKYNITSKYILGNEKEYLNDLEKLKKLTDEFAANAHTYYQKNGKFTVEEKELNREALSKSFYSISTHINDMILKNITYDKERYTIFRNLSVLSFVLVFFATFWYRKRVNAIYEDIRYLFSTDKHVKPYQIFSVEADAISLRMKRKNVVTDNPAMTDQVTGINNYKGLINSYSIKKGMKDSNFTSVTIVEIDNFSKSKRTFPQDLTQAILKKIAFTISLHEQPTDVIARTDYNQFTIVLSRASKEQSFKDVDIIRQSIAELKFNIPNADNITVTGGFIIKPNNTNLEEAIKQAKEILKHAQAIAKNKIFQTRDIAELHI